MNWEKGGVSFYIHARGGELLKGNWCFRNALEYGGNIMASQCKITLGQLHTHTDEIEKGLEAGKS